LRANRTERSIRSGGSQGIFEQALRQCAGCCQGLLLEVRMIADTESMRPDRTARSGHDRDLDPISANSQRGQEALASMNPDDSGYIPGSRRIRAWESANGSVPAAITVPVTVNAPARPTALTRSVTPADQPAAGAFSEDISVVWYLLGRFAEGLAAGYAQSRAQPTPDVLLKETPRQRPFTCTSAFYNVGGAPVYRCQ
jgi:hypothetical protein